MPRTTFTPGPRAMNWLIFLTMAATGWALYVRYMVIEPSVVGLACDAGLTTFLCRMRAIVILLFGWSVFGGLALAAAVIQLLRPSVPMLAAGLAFSGISLVLYNNLAGAVAAMLLILSLARPGRVTA
ncbi:hypothetical protein [Aquabacter spiritensis]|uniref:Uncharacterized protein n=1 Tax=Aquabacter spiritensis TaxID=933073 RepID=A0A4R3LQY7_9HYPH|nr:hypothetical protein [Aquabacter spiritensis]TCT02882.1 hypothetical protein EDC64_11154 [Aquabacter spiritensis]